HEDHRDELARNGQPAQQDERFEPHGIGAAHRRRRGFQGVGHCRFAVVCGGLWELYSRFQVLKIFARGLDATGWDPRFDYVRDWRDRNMNTAIIKPAWSPLTIALMVLGFIIFWPLGMAVLA